MMIPNLIMSCQMVDMAVGRRRGQADGEDVGAAPDPGGDDPGTGQGREVVDCGRGRGRCRGFVPGRGQGQG